MNGGDPCSILALRVRGERFGISLRHVDRVVSFAKLLPLPNAPLIVLGLLDFHGRPVPVFDLQALTAGTRGSYGISSRLVLGATERRDFAVAADEVMGVANYPPAAVSDLEPLVPGAARLPGVVPADGGLVFIYDPDAYLTAREAEQLDSALKEHAP